MLNKQKIGSWILKSQILISNSSRAGHTKTDLDLEGVGISNAVLMKKGMVMGLLSLTQLFVSKNLPMSITATINALSPLVNSFMAAFYLNEK